ncbi:hypothetical protein SeMB42_g04007 [Synchytrium endobioticum]|uniref:Uncharacterized protein n=1 Tax=Synchytrium endobioticum TaxID=286115 RepID=A0A507D277_9FUNG|nr:hypothetical protein SeMB42_g04007 [Synchytrium endobioticum]
MQLPSSKANTIQFRNIHRTRGNSQSPGIYSLTQCAETYKYPTYAIFRVFPSYHGPNTHPSYQVLSARPSQD